MALPIPKIQMISPGVAKFVPTRTIAPIRQLPPPLPRLLQVECLVAVQYLAPIMRLEKDVRTAALQDLRVVDL